jgi:peptidoglycan/xylan/chitin deacetylase (PgdA/CDA1 family)
VGLRLVAVVIILGHLVLALPAAPVSAGAQAPSRVSRQVTITFDDLPAAGPGARSLAAQERLTERLVAALRRHQVPAIGFVNEGKLRDGGGAIDARRVALLGRWLDAGLELGNHTYSHLDLHSTPLAEYERDVVRGEETIRRLLAARGRKPRFFRHPFLHTGRTLETRAAFEAFLAERGYRVAPVTFDNYDYLFAAAYDRSLSAGDAATAERVLAAYPDYLEEVVAYYEQQSRALLGREIPQILLLHANCLNAERFDAVAAMLERRGYRFVPLEGTLTDAAYASLDTYTGPAGITWLHRWALTAGKSGAFFAGEPVVPGWVERAGQPRAPAPR